VRRAFLTQSRLDKRATVFAGLRNTPPAEVLVTGNDLGDAIPTSPGHTYIHVRETAARR
jgi:hypothetical protein